MQAVFSEHEQRVKAFRRTLSEPRFARYLRASKGLELDAVYLYHWNCCLAQSLYFSLHMWEIALRNRLNTYLCGKYGPDWPYDDVRAVRNFTTLDRKRLRKTIDKEEWERDMSPVPTGVIVADLSAGFWVSQLSKSYDLAYSWRKELYRIFPHEPTIQRATASNICTRLLDVRNRVAHHEPIFQMDLPEIRDDLDRMLAALCETSFAYASAACTFRAVLNAGPLTA
jgi:hypothetical protein